MVAPEVTLVTGASGFVGRALVHRLVHDGAAVRVAVRACTPSLPAPVEQIPTGAFSEATDWRRLTTGARRVVHLAARVHMLRDDASDPLAEYRRLNVASTLQLARAAAANGVERFVFVSTVKVHGEQTLPGRPFTEADALSADMLRDEPYALSKLEAENGLKAIARETDMEVTIIRPPLVYGPGVRANFARLVRAVELGIPLPLGGLSNSRSLIALDNLVDALLAASTHPAAANEAFMVSDDDDLSTTELLRRIASAMGRTARLLPIPGTVLLAGASVLGKRAWMRRLVDSLQVDIAKMRRLLGWRPPISVDRGLRQVVTTNHGIR